ncbi:hypothetical protein SDJN02_03957, partial [Cucurbita argyrosperma subsp. argyrosperma]
MGISQPHPQPFKAKFIAAGILQRLELFTSFHASLVAFHMSEKLTLTVFSISEARLDLEIE